MSVQLKVIYVVVSFLLAGPCPITEGGDPLHISYEAHRHISYGTYSLSQDLKRHLAGRFAIPRRPWYTYVSVITRF